jgi:hypothetical protein
MMTVEEQQINALNTIGDGLKMLVTHLQRIAHALDAIARSQDKDFKNLSQTQQQQHQPRR